MEINNDEIRRINIETFRKIRPGELTYFVSQGEVIPDTLLDALKDNPQHYPVNIITAPLREFTHKAIIIFPCILYPNKSQFRVATIPLDGRYVFKALHFLFNEINEIILPQQSRIAQIRISDYRDYMPQSGFACGTPFVEIDKSEETIDQEIDEKLDEQQHKFINQLIELTHQYAVKFHKMPPLKLIEQAAIGRLAISTPHLSPIVITDDLRITLPLFNNLEIHMTPLCKTVYILFLLHPEGIRLKNINEYADKLRHIYKLIKKRKDPQTSFRDDLYIQGLINVFDSWSINQKISRTRSAIKRHIPYSKYVDRYCITGTRGETYSINLPQELIQMPDFLISNKNKTP